MIIPCVPHLTAYYSQCNVNYVGSIWDIMQQVGSYLVASCFLYMCPPRAQFLIWWCWWHVCKMQLGASHCMSAASVNVCSGFTQAFHLEETGKPMSLYSRYLTSLSFVSFILSHLYSGVVYYLSLLESSPFPHSLCPNCDCCLFEMNFLCARALIVSFSSIILYIAVLWTSLKAEQKHFLYIYIIILVIVKLGSTVLYKMLLFTQFCPCPSIAARMVSWDLSTAFPSSQSWSFCFKYFHFLNVAIFLQNVSRCFQ